jgi:hypothetical protein
VAQNLRALSPVCRDFSDSALWPDGAGTVDEDGSTLILEGVLSTDHKTLQVGRYTFAAEVIYGEPRVRDQEFAEQLAISIVRVRDAVRDLTRKGELRNVLTFLVSKSGKTKSQSEFWFTHSQLVLLVSRFSKGGKPGGKSEVYFIQNEQANMIKIGFSTDVNRRLDSLQTASPHPLQLMLSVPGSLQDEHSLHRLFDSCRGHGEWFEPHPDLLEFIDTCRDLYKIPNPPRLRDLISQVEAKYK